MTEQTLDDFIEENIYIRNELVMPLWWEWCRNNGLEFAFLDRVMGSKEYHVALEAEQKPILWDALQLFNQANQYKLHHFGDTYYNIQFTTWGGDISYTKIDRDHLPNEFMNIIKINKSVMYKYYKLFNIMVIFGLLLSLATAILCMDLISKFLPGIAMSTSYSTPIFIMLLSAMGFFYYRFIRRYTRIKPEHIAPTLKVEPYLRGLVSEIERERSRLDDDTNTELNRALTDIRKRIIATRAVDLGK